MLDGEPKDEGMARGGVWGAVGGGGWPPRMLTTDRWGPAEPPALADMLELVGRIEDETAAVLSLVGGVRLDEHDRTAIWWPDTEVGGMGERASGAPCRPILTVIRN